MEKTCQSENRTFYHITLRSNLESILNKGFIPDISIKCQKCYNDNPTKKLVYMTDLESVKACRNALYKENDDCIIFEVNCAELKLIKRCKYIHGPENIKLTNLWHSIFIYIQTNSLDGFF